MASKGGAGIYWLVAVVALLCVGTPVYVAWTTVTDRADKAGMTEAATSYLDAWRDGRTAWAQALTCRENGPWKPGPGPLPDLAEDDLASYGPVEATVHRSSDTPTLYSVDVELTYADRTSRPVRFWMSEQDAGWRICSMGDAD